jgi:hypothetical protein
MEQAELNTIEKKTMAVDSWVNKITTEGKVDPINASLVRKVLESFGANFEISEEAKTSLEKYKNVDRRLGMDAVWGTQKVKEYRIWLKHWVESYETKNGKPLPVLEGTDTKTSGGLKFFTDLTVFAAGIMDFTTYKELTEDRARKGRVWQARRGDEPIVPTPHSSFPPEFPSVAWEKIKNLI